MATKTKDEIIRSLKSYITLKTKMNYIADKIKLIDDALSKCRTANLSEIRGVGEEYKIEKLIDEKNIEISKLKRLEIDKQLILTMVGTLEGIKKEVVIQYYLKGISINEIANDKKYTPRYIRKIKSIAIDNIFKFIN